MYLKPNGANTQLAQFSFKTEQMGGGVPPLACLPFHVSKAKWGQSAAGSVQCLKNKKTGRQPAELYCPPCFEAGSIYLLKNERAGRQPNSASHLTRFKAKWSLKSWTVMLRDERMEPPCTAPGALPLHLHHLHLHLHHLGTLLISVGLYLD